MDQNFNSIFTELLFAAENPGSILVFDKMEGNLKGDLKGSLKGGL